MRQADTLSDMLVFETRNGALMNRDDASQIASLLTSASSQVAEALEVLRGRVDGGEFRDAAKATGEVLALIDYHLLSSVTRRFPELDPEHRSPGD